MRGQQPVADRRPVEALRQQVVQREVVAGGAADLLAVGHHHFGVHPELGQRLAAEPAGDGDLVVAVREGQVGAGRVDVERLAQVADGHAGALDVPARPGLAPGRVPEDAGLELRQRGALEQGEVAGMVLLVVVVGRRRLAPHLLRLDPRELPVVRETADAEVDRAQLLVGQALFQQAAGLLDHVAHVLAGPGIVVRPQDAQRVEGLRRRPLPSGR